MTWIPKKAIVAVHFINVGNSEDFMLFWPFEISMS